MEQQAYQVIMTKSINDLAFTHAKTFLMCITTASNQRREKHKKENPSQVNITLLFQNFWQHPIMSDCIG